MTESVVDYSEQPLAVEVDDVTMIFNMASESLTNLKEYFIKLAKHELFFEEFRALKHISFDIHRGEVVGLVGTNGSGKSTMLKIIAGVLEPSEGSVKVHGNIAPLIELGAGFDPELTARENIYLNGALLGYTKEFIDQEEYFTLTFFGEEYRKALSLCGSKSGRDIDKVKECGFTVKTAECGAPYFEQAELVLVCRKRFAQALDAKNIPQEIREKWYPEKDYHTLYIGEIVEVLQK